MSEAQAEPGWEDYGNWGEGKALTAGPWYLGIYQPSPETVGYWQGVKRGELLVKSCSECSRKHHPRRIVCSECGSHKLGWQRVSGRGKIYSFSEIHRAVSPVASKTLPYTVGVVQLEEGVYLMTRLYGDAAHPITVDAPVTVEFRVLEAGYSLPVFVTAAGAQ